MANEQTNVENDSKEEKLSMSESPVSHIQSTDENIKEVNNMNKQPQINHQNYRNDFYPQQQYSQPEHFHYGNEVKLTKRNFWTNGLSVNETRISTLVVAFIAVICFSLFMYAKHGDISPNLTAIVQWIVMGIAGINIGGMVGGIFSGGSNNGSSMYGGSVYGSFGTYNNSTNNISNTGYNNSNYNNSNYNNVDNDAGITITNTANVTSPNDNAKG